MTATPGGIGRSHGTLACWLRKFGMSLFFLLVYRSLSYETLAVHQDVRSLSKLIAAGSMSYKAFSFRIRSCRVLFSLCAVRIVTEE